MTVLYFTSTGNSLYVAKKIGGKLISIPKLLKSNSLTIEDDKIGLVFPVYGMMPPPIVVEFLEKAILKADYFLQLLHMAHFRRVLF